MKHRKYEELILTAVYEELDTLRKTELEAHLAVCEDCRRESREVQAFRDLLDSGSRTIPENLLAEARAQLRGALSSEPPRKAGRGWTRDLFDWFFWHRAPLASAASVLAGLLLGYLFFAHPTPSSPGLPADHGDLDITNVRFLDPDPEDGSIEMTYDLVRPVRVRGRLTDSSIQKTLAQALLTSRNPGVRLRAVGAIEEQPFRDLDAEVRKALTSSVMHDENAGVRRRALELLSKSSFSEGLRETLLYVLLNDDNAGMRVAAINALDTMQVDNWKPSRQTLEALERHIGQEENDFVRLRSEAFLQEVQYK